MPDLPKNSVVFGGDPNGRWRSVAVDNKGEVDVAVNLEGVVEKISE
jgi:hypothetical protein